MCESVALTMVRARIWPGSPSNPHLGFTFDLMEWANALLLECQVAIKDFCSAIVYKCPYFQMKVNILNCKFLMYNNCKTLEKNVLLTVRPGF